MLREAYDKLLAAYGPQHWWPAETRLEVLIGAILTQNTSWKNVERAIENLKASDVLSLPALFDLSSEELEELLRPSGYYRQKAAKLQRVLTLIQEQFDGSLDALFALDLESLRETLLRVNGIGPETADAICLYAADKPTFVIDAYTNRVVKRHGWADMEAGYYELKEQFETALPHDPQLFGEYHALLVEVGKRHCKKTPDCEGCPLQELLPESGVCEW